MFAVRDGHNDVVEELIKKGADLSLTNGDANGGLNAGTAMHIAIVNDRFDLAARLLELGADANDGSLFLAVDAHDATTDMRARDGSKLRPDHPVRHGQEGSHESTLVCQPIQGSQAHTTSWYDA